MFSRQGWTRRRASRPVCDLGELHQSFMSDRALGIDAFIFCRSARERCAYSIKLGQRTTVKRRLVTLCAERRERREESGTKGMARDDSAEHESVAIWAQAVLSRHPANRHAKRPRRAAGPDPQGFTGISAACERISRHSALRLGVFVERRRPCRSCRAFSANPVRAARPPGTTSNRRLHSHGYRNCIAGCHPFGRAT